MKRMERLIAVTYPESLANSLKLSDNEFEDEIKTISLKLGRLELLRRLYGEIIIPKEVYREIEKGKDKGYYSDLSILEWIHIKEIQDRHTL